MGFRNRRRHRGGGGGGGGGQHQQQHHFFGGEPNGLNPGDDVGNRKSFKPIIVPPEDLGNRKDPDEVEWIPEENIGNRVDAAPTHEISGVLADLAGGRGGNHRRRRPKGVSAPERIGRFVIGGVNPLIAGGMPQASMEAAHRALEALSQDGGQEPRPDSRDAPRDLRDNNNRDSNRDGRDNSRDHRDNNPRDGRDNNRDSNRGDRGGGRDRPRRFESVDGHAATHDVSERRAQRFFDFAEDDRFEYTLKTTPEQKRKEGEDIVAAVAREAGRDATVVAKLLEDGTRPKVLVTIEERGPSADLGPERRAAHAQEPLFVMGNAALMSLNYLVNKIVNRYPDDRIRLAVLPASDEKLYMESLAEHQRTRGAAPAPAPRPAAPPAAVVEAPVERASGFAPVTEVPAPSPVAPVEDAEVEATSDDDDAPKKPRARAVKKSDDDDAPVKKARAAADDDTAAPKKGRAKAEDDAPAAKKARAKAEEEETAKKPVRRAPKKAPAIETVILKR